VALELAVLSTIRRALEQRQVDVERQQTVVMAERLRLDDQRQQLDALRETVERGAQRVQEDARRLAAAQNELAAVAGALQPQGIDPNTNVGSDSTRRLALHEELATLHDQLRRAQTQVSHLAGSAPELRAARREVEKLRRRLMRQNARLAQAKAQGEAQQSQELQQIREQRNRLACELEASRARVTELAAQIELLREQVGGERKSWLGELRRLRQAIETEFRGGGNPAANSRGAHDFGRPEESLDSILAQFEILQKELSQRLQPVLENPAEHPALGLDSTFQPREEFS